MMDLPELPKRKAIVEDELAVKRVEEMLGNYLDYLQNSVDEEGDHETITGEVYCGCDTCYMRETLALLVPMIAELLEAKAVTLEDA